MLFIRADDSTYGDSAIAERFDNQSLINADDEKLGSVDKVFVNVNDANDIYLEANLGGGFLGLGSKEFLVPVGKLTARSDGRFFLDMPKDETKMQGRLVPGDGQAFLEGILAPPYGYAEGPGTGVKEAIGGGTGLPGGNFAGNVGDYGGRRVTSNTVDAHQGKITDLKGHRLYEPGNNEQFGTIEEVYCDLSTGEPKLLKIRYGGDAQPGGFFSLFGRGHDVLVSLDALVRTGEEYYLRDQQVVRIMHSADEERPGEGTPALGL
ncbi:PRC-barrel domain-containing protein [Gloeobacter morelensis]|uniref:PRC-barrel domain-containing protein n=1 Tax=Gloeobacter morelensis MG652769 TaxID=2781736 RepID=A0ABY3PK78_9CYAN|nr:PRC-barrel domain-containing protein [Gloeobacter morelensis]UFP93948.1 PRC-barrel domain-containing protein [Gloeobacter morelensis MG652769]